MTSKRSGQLAAAARACRADVDSATLPSAILMLVTLVGALMIALNSSSLFHPTSSGNVANTQDSRVCAFRVTKTILRESVLPGAHC